MDEKNDPEREILKILKSIFDLNEFDKIQFRYKFQTTVFPGANKSLLGCDKRILKHSKALT